MDDEEETNTARFIVSFPPEKETKELWLLSYIFKEVMLDLNPYQLVQTTKHKDDNNK